MTAFLILWIVDAIASLLVFYFFFIGLADGSISTRNMGLWITIITVICMILGGSYWLQLNQYHLAAKLLLCVLAIPAFLYLLFILVSLTNKGRWN